MSYDKPIIRERSPSSEANATIATIAVGLIGLTLSETIMLLIFKSGMPREAKLFFIRNGEGFFTLAIVAVFLVASRMGRQGLLAALASLTISLAAFLSFRGSWVWQGFFDRYEDSKATWYWACLIGVVVGGALFTALTFRRTTPKGISSAVRDFSLGTLAILTFISFLEARSIPIDSAFESTRFIPLGIATLVLAIFRMFSDQS